MIADDTSHYSTPSTASGAGEDPISTDQTTASDAVEGVEATEESRSTPSGTSGQPHGASKPRRIRIRARIAPDDQD